MNKWKKMFAKLPIKENVSWYLKENVLLRGNGSVEQQLNKNVKQGLINNVLMLSRKSANPSLTQNVGKKCKVVKKYSWRWIKVQCSGSMIRIATFISKLVDYTTYNVLHTYVLHILTIIITYFMIFFSREDVEM